MRLLSIFYIKTISFSVKLLYFCHRIRYYTYMHYLYLTLAIVLEVLATALLGKSEGFSKWLFAVGSLLSYGVCFYFLSLALKNIPLGVAYAIWSGVGIVLTAIVSILIFKNKIDLPFVLGSLLIIAGVVEINLFSKANGH